MHSINLKNKALLCMKSIYLVVQCVQALHMLNDPGHLSGWTYHSDRFWNKSSSINQFFFIVAVDMVLDFLIKYSDTVSYE